MDKQILVGDPSDLLVPTNEPTKPYFDVRTKLHRVASTRIDPPSPAGLLASRGTGLRCSKTMERGVASLSVDSRHLFLISRRAITECAQSVHREDGNKHHGGGGAGTY